MSGNPDMIDTKTAWLSEVTREEFERLVRKSGHRTESLSQANLRHLWAEAEAVARQRLQLPSYSEVSCGKRYYDKNSGWQVKQKPSMFGILLLCLWLAGMAAMAVMGTRADGFDPAAFLPSCLSKFGVLMIWVAHWAGFALYSFNVTGRVRLRDIFGNDFATVIAGLLLPLLSAPIWMPVVHLLAAMFGVRC